MADEADMQEPDPRMRDVNFALTSFLGTASTAANSPAHSPWASSTDVAQVSSFNDELDDGDDLDLAHAPTLTREDGEPEILSMLAKEPAYCFTNERWPDCSSPCGHTGRVL